MLSLAVAGCSEQGKNRRAARLQAVASSSAPPAKVSVAAMKQAEYPVTRILPGRAVAFQTADIRPRVNGMIEKITFKEGSKVKAGDLLYKIDDDTYRAALEQAKLRSQKAEASVPSAQANFSRYERPSTAARHR